VKGKIVLVPFSFTDLSGSKLRPALVLVEGEVDSVVAFISSRIPAQPATTEVLIPQDHIEFGLTGLKTASIVRLAALTHHQLVYIHPFTDGNGRVARLLMNLILLRYGYPIALILRVDRKKYLDSLGKADAGNLAPFANFIAANVEQSLDTYLRAMNPEQDPLLTISEACKGTRFSPEYISLLARTRRLPALKIGRKWMISKSTLREYMNEVS
jgi:excisionase family DNA binding protein